jgi:hydrogenase small subunit
MSVTRRDFLKVCGGTATFLGLSKLQVLEALAQAKEGKPAVLWIQGAGCTGCSVSLLNAVDPDIAKVLLEIISLKFHPTVMASSGEMAMDKLYDAAKTYDGKYFLVVEGGVPTGANGRYCIVGERKGKEITMLELTKRMGQRAAGVLAVGACAAFGGIPAAKPNPTGVKSVQQIFKDSGIKTPLINIGGCPPHPTWMVGTIAHILTKGIPELDGYKRPKLFFQNNIHDNCPYLKYYDQQKFAKNWGEKDACRVKLGCKGPDTNADCYKKIWNNGVNWCVDNAICIGCVEPTFPDGVSPLYEQTTG